MSKQLDDISSHIVNEPVTQNKASNNGENDVVVSGISGRFPGSSNMEELKKNLYDGVDMVTENDSRWPIDLYGLPHRFGVIKDILLFDAAFFPISNKQAQEMDSHLRMLLKITDIFLGVFFGVVR